MCTCTYKICCIVGNNIPRLYIHNYYVTCDVYILIYAHNY